MSNKSLEWVGVSDGVAESLRELEQIAEMAAGEKYWRLHCAGLVLRTALSRLANALLYLNQMIEESKKERNEYANN